MEYNLLGISALIVIILGLTWLKDGEKMDPPLKKRIVIDVVTIAIFWGVFEFYKFSNVKLYNHEIEFVINSSLLFSLHECFNSFVKSIHYFKNSFSISNQKDLLLRTKK